MNDKQYTREVLINLNEKLKTKQAALKIDNTPTVGSVNPVTSEGIKEYIDNNGGATFVAGENIQIEGDVISATDTKYEAGVNISINDNIISAVVQNDKISTVAPTLKIPYKWEKKTWTGLTSFDAENVWSDGQNTYYSSGSTQYRKHSDSSWVVKSWTGLTSFNGKNVWTDGGYVYYNDVFGNVQSKILNSNHTGWSDYTWYDTEGNELYFKGTNVFSDGYNIYMRASVAPGNFYYLDKESNRWVNMGLEWANILVGDFAQNIWTDGENTYYSYGETNCILNKGTKTWERTMFYGYYNDRLEEWHRQGACIWSDGTNIYSSVYNYTIRSWILDKKTKIWYPIDFVLPTEYSSYAQMDAKYLWKDLYRPVMYFSNGYIQMVLNLKLIKTNLR